MLQLKKQLKGEGAACNTGMCGRMHGCNGFWFNMWPLRSSDRVACVQDINLTEHVQVCSCVDSCAACCTFVSLCKEKFMPITSRAQQH